MDILADIRCVVEKSSEKSNRFATHARLRSTLRSIVEDKLKRINVQIICPGPKFLDVYEILTTKS